MDVSIHHDPFAPDSLFADREKADESTRDHRDLKILSELGSQLGRKAVHTHYRKVKSVAS